MTLCNIMNFAKWNLLKSWLGVQTLYINCVTWCGTWSRHIMMTKWQNLHQFECACHPKWKCCHKYVCSRICSYKFFLMLNETKFSSRWMGGTYKWWILMPYVWIKYKSCNNFSNNHLKLILSILSFVNFTKSNTVHVKSSLTLEKGVTKNSRRFSLVQ